MNPAYCATKDVVFVGSIDFGLLRIGRCALDDYTSHQLRLDQEALYRADELPSSIDHQVQSIAAPTYPAELSVVLKKEMK